MRIRDWSSDVCSSDLNDALGRRVVGFDDLAHFLVDRMRGLIRHTLGLRHRLAEKDFAIVIGIRARSELGGQTPLRDHVASNPGRAPDVVAGTGRYLLRSANHFLRDPAAEPPAYRRVQEIRRASIRESVCKSGYISVTAVYLKTQKQLQT